MDESAPDVIERPTDNKISLLGYVCETKSIFPDSYQKTPTGNRIYYDGVDINSVHPTTINSYYDAMTHLEKGHIRIVSEPIIESSKVLRMGTTKEGFKWIVKQKIVNGSYVNKYMLIINKYSDYIMYKEVSWVEPIEYENYVELCIKEYEDNYLYESRW